MATPLLKKSAETDGDLGQINEMLSSLYSQGLPRNLQFSAGFGDVISVSSRDMTYIERYEMYSDPFTREAVKVIIARSIGVTHDDVKPFHISLSSELDIDESLRDQIKKEFDYLVNIIDDSLLEVAIDSQFFGDGFAKRVISRKNGVEKLVTNFSTKPINIVPIVSNNGDDVAYEVSANTSIISGARNSSSISKNGRKYVSPVQVARLNSPSNGISSITTESISSLDSHDVFVNELRVYEDNIYGGVMEGCINSFRDYQWAVRALVNTRIASSVVERFITHNLGQASESERKLLKDALERQIVKVQESLKERMASKDSTYVAATHHIPTAGDGVNGVSIQESSFSGNGLSSIEDIMMHIKRYLGDIGFSIELTPYGSGSQGGGERDGVIQNSLQMDVQGSQIRKGIRNYVLDTIKVHFLAKFDMEIDLSKVEVSFTSVMNKSKMNAESQRLEAISNVQSMSSVISEFRGLELEDNADNRLMLEEVISPIISQTTKNKDVQIRAIISAILTPPKNEDGGF